MRLLTDVRHIRERERIGDALDRMFRGFEEYDWAAVRSVLGRRITFEQTSIGGVAIERSREEALAGWQRSHHEQKINFHLLGRYWTRIEGSHATVAVNCSVCKVLDSALGGGMWQVWGRHDITLRRTGAGWRVVGLEFTKIYSVGDDRVYAHTTD